MNIHSSGIVITENENKGIQHLVADVEATIRASLTAKIATRKDALIADWRNVLLEDDSVTSLPDTTDGTVALILARSDYKTRLQHDAVAPVLAESTFHRDAYAATTRSGTTVTLFDGGITIPDLDGNAVLAYVQNLEEWMMGAVLGHINRGTKRLITTWEPILMADASVTSLPATKDAWITTVTARTDYTRGG
jgi:hypothetical protein